MSVREIMVAMVVDLLTGVFEEKTQNGVLMALFPVVYESF